MEPENLALRPRDVRFDWSELPAHWVPGEPFVTHALNVMHILLPEGERWFVDVFKEALPLITDERLREDVVGFIGQEAMHASAHQGAQDHLIQHGIDPGPYVRQLEWFFRERLNRPDGGRRWLVARLSVIAAIEHMTAFLGHWVLNSPELDEAKTDPTMLDLLRWHGAEEVEHRSVAHDLFVHIDGGFANRIAAMTVALPFLVWLWTRGVRYLMSSDPRVTGKARWRDLVKAGRKGLLPTVPYLASSLSRYYKRGYHPSQEGSTSQAVAYLASSPAALTAEQ
ncbi:metal-dependent hydrolase [Kibdelosporangium phytohabitans]|uniref:Metal-dependent hydrolase n=1 Tax=Kibdelosporangium phytohabitans TaxID=860235 RepID=A0A0N9IJK1_9PSEU|nr:metal-dependent hydrolase [Kibdelosporangium phytohabitans]ALG15293.1 metal-dependent hydrolase [Kibdelosporangium phytohabitans]MBE1462716.1 putative metal-dependent hydrolase [Kibdelosporangium phytohabitans]